MNTQKQQNKNLLKDISQNNHNNNNFICVFIFVECKQIKKKKENSTQKIN